MGVEIGAIVEAPEYMADRLPEDFRERAFRFTCKLFDYCEDLARTPGPARQIANQLFDAGSSIGANLEESKASYRRRELASKNAISLKESRESKYWLRVATAKSLGKKDLREWLLQEADEFVAMLTVSVRRLQTERDPSQS
jgi:four helix bundle protein